MKSFYVAAVICAISATSLLAENGLKVEVTSQIGIKDKGDSPDSTPVPQAKTRSSNVIKKKKVGDTTGSVSGGAATAEGTDK